MVAEVCGLFGTRVDSLRKYNENNNMRAFAKKIIICVSVVTLIPLASFANPTKEFITSCTYGVLTGTLVGIASLAFTDQPGDNLQNVARGASLGLYLGIALGVYVVYIVPGQDNEEDLLNNQLPPIEGEVQYKIPKLMVSPTVANNRLDGVFVNWNVASF